MRPQLPHYFLTSKTLTLVIPQVGRNCTDPGPTWLEENVVMLSATAGGLAAMMCCGLPLFCMAFIRRRRHKPDEHIVEAAVAAAVASTLESAKTATAVAVASTAKLQQLRWKFAAQAFKPAAALPPPEVEVALPPPPPPEAPPPPPPPPSPPPPPPPSPPPVDVVVPLPVPAPAPPSPPVTPRRAFSVRRGGLRSPPPPPVESSVSQLFQRPSFQLAALPLPPPPPPTPPPMVVPQPEAMTVVFNRGDLRGLVSLDVSVPPPRPPC
jgi:hypothetical protein